MQACVALEQENCLLEGLDCEAFERGIQRTIEEHGLFSRDSKVLVACSGGKDSTVILHVLKALGYDVEAITVDAHIGCYTEENLRNLRRTCDGLGVRLYEVSFRKEFGGGMCFMQQALKAKGHGYKNCHVCGVLRRQLLNKHSRTLHADVLVTGHNLDDEAQAIMMNLMRGQLFLAARTGPKSEGGGGFTPRVKPMYFCRQKDVVAYSRLKGLPVKYTECPCNSEAYRREIRAMFKDFTEEEKENIVRQFLWLQPALKRLHAGPKAGSCSTCGEPSSGSMCAACLMLREAA